MGTGGGENLDDKADVKIQKVSDSNLTNRASRELVEMWRSGSQDAARVLLARYEVRLVALVASRLNRKYRGGIAPEDLVQSAMGSFFRVTRANASPSIKLESTASAWNILATFVRRKLARALERETAAKRGGGRTRISLDDLETDLSTNPSVTEANELLDEIHSMLNSDHSRLLELLLENKTQREIAEQLGVDERTIRRRIKSMQDIVRGQLASVDQRNGVLLDPTIETINLPNISYRQFVLGKLVGTGALGKVYRAILKSDGQVVAVKFMHRHLWTNPHSKLSFLREIDHASKINHRGVVKYLGWGHSPHGGPYLVSEYVDGQSLANVKPNDSSTAVEWLAQICKAVAAAHDAAVVHGDLTPNNILLDSEGRIVVTDFGFSTYSQKPIIDDAECELIASLGGTLGFAAPEQISPAFGTIGFTTDIYAIGGLAFYLLAGQSPHDSGSLLDTVADEDLILPNIPVTPAEAQLAAVAKITLKKAISSRPHLVAELFTLLTD
ncbi:protein kinase domain-containing protein [Pirellula sp. SH-Sr6A]|uniref:protein kinase domain-containing protein n=1 Tax=Pirellula sp. SH-Sr6A TaxID=1632865 RepID=UPI000A91DAB5|nr:protein kinase [Pirellula sp. SH-Sr6A]